MCISIILHYRITVCISIILHYRITVCISIILHYRITVCISIILHYRIQPAAKAHSGPVKSLEICPDDHNKVYNVLP